MIGRGPVAQLPADTIPPAEANPGEGDAAAVEIAQSQVAPLPRPTQDSRSQGTSSRTAAVAGGRRAAPADGPPVREDAAAGQGARFDVQEGEPLGGTHGRRARCGGAVAELTKVVAAPAPGQV